MRSIQVIILSVWYAQALCCYQSIPGDDSIHSSTEFLPIISYDTDVGLGFGVKCFLVNHFCHDESFDFVLFNSTKGERWYRLVFSIPDFELRRGKTYPLAIDVTGDYDKWISSNFFGVGNTSCPDHKETYTRESVEFSITVGRGITRSLVAQVGLSYKAVRNFNLSDKSRLIALPPDLNASRASSASVILSLRYDTRNSVINPSQGIVIQGETEVAPRLGISNVAITRHAAWVQYYSEVLSSGVTVASRVGAQVLVGEGIPVQFLLPVGGSGTLRGYPQDRFLDKISTVGNVEVRFPIVWRFGGVAGFDAGKVWHSPDQLDLARWATNPMTGLRLYMDTFVVRIDVGFGRVSTGLYLNFGQLF